MNPYDIVAVEQHDDGSTVVVFADGSRHTHRRFRQGTSEPAAPYDPSNAAAIDNAPTYVTKRSDPRKVAYDDPRAVGGHRYWQAWPLQGWSDVAHIGHRWRERDDG